MWPFCDLPEWDEIREKADIGRRIELPLFHVIHTFTRNAILVLEYFRMLVERAGGRNYQSLINDALLAHIHQRSMLDAVRQVVKEELSVSPDKRGLTAASRRTRLKRAA